jgi:hypothetical protein
MWGRGLGRSSSWHCYFCSEQQSPAKRLVDRRPTQSVKVRPKNTFQKEPRLIASLFPLLNINFVQAVESFYDSYDNAPNELQKSALRTDRKEKLAEVMPSLDVHEWVGVIDDMSTNRDGKGVVAISLVGTNDITVGTWNNALSDIGSDSLISQNDPVYNSLSRLSKGESVVFSGSFLPSDMDYLKEMSFTELGSMKEPEFLMRFSEIRAAH